MRLIHAAAFALCLLTVAPVGSFAGDPKRDVSAAYAAFDTAFNKGRREGRCRLISPEREGATANPRGDVGSGGDREIFRRAAPADGLTDHKLEVIDAAGDDKVIYGSANWSAKGKDKRWGVKPANLAFPTHVFERQADGSLKLRLHTFN